MQVRLYFVKIPIDVSKLIFDFIMALRIPALSGVLTQIFLARHLLHIYVLLHVRNLNFLLVEAAVHLGIKRITDATA